MRILILTAILLLDTAAGGVVLSGRAVEGAVAATPAEVFGLCHERRQHIS